MSEEKVNGDLAPVVHVSPTLGLVDESTRDPVKDLIGVRNIRATIANAISAKGIPIHDPEMLDKLLKTLKDLDASSLGQMRLTIEQQSLDAQEEKRELAAAALGILFENKAAGAVIVKTNPNTVVPSLDDEVDPSEFVPGEGAVGTVVDTFESFSSRVGGVELSDEELDDDIG